MSEIPSDSPEPPAPTGLLESAKYDPNNSILRVLIFDIWFRIGASLFLLVFVALALFLPKIWRTTPADFLPVIKISGLEKVQAWSLRRSAEKLAAAGQFAEANIAWQSAVKNDPGDPELLRGSLRTLLGQPNLDRSNIGFGVDRSLWLLRLTGTNTADLALSVRFLHRSFLDDYVFQLADARTPELTDEALADFVVACFRQGRMDRFSKLWEEHGPAFTNSPALRLYLFGWQAAWGPPRTLQSGRRALVAAQGAQDPDLVLLAHEIQLAVSSSLNDLDAYQYSLDWLIEHHADRVGAHVTYWQMLVTSGQRQQAQVLAKSFSKPPENPMDAAGLGALYVRLGLEDYALEFLEKQISEFGYYPRLWILLAQLQSQFKRWNDLRGLAVAMRNSPALRNQLDGYSQFLSGLADLNLGRVETAASTFVKIPGEQFADPLVAYSVATELLRLGYSEVSAKMLTKLESNFGGNASFWFELTSAAYEARAMEVLSTAARKAWELEPTRIDLIHNYAAVLLVLRERPEQAIKLTLGLLARDPNRVEFKINHAVALLRNGRLLEAEVILLGLNPTHLNVNESAEINYAWFELDVARGNLAAARRIYPTIQRTQLLQPQIDWMDAEFKKIESAVAQ